MSVGRHLCNINPENYFLQVFIGGWGNTKSVIRRNRTKPEKVEIDTPQILNAGEFRGFWIRWDSGIISAGREGEAIPFLSWADPEPFPIAFIGVCTGWGASGTWKIEGKPPYNPGRNVPNDSKFTLLLSAQNRLNSILRTS